MAVDVIVPPLGATVDTLTLVSWYKNEGETVTKDEPLFSVETDKATLDVEAPASGILAQVGAQPGAEVVALSRIAVIAAPGESVATTAPTSPASTVSSVSSPISSASPTNGSAPPVERRFISPRAKRLAEARQMDWRALSGTGPEGAIVERDILTALQNLPAKTATPVAQRIAAETGVDWTQLSGSGPGGKVVREDVQRALGGPPPQEQGKGAFELSPVFSQSAAEGRADNEAREVITVSGARGVIAQRMLESATTTAPVTLISETDATELAALRARLKADGVAVSYNDLLLAILARALREHPRLNASWQGDTITLWKRIHIGVAVDAESGLRVPVVRDVDRKGLTEIGQEVAALVEEARQGRLSPEAMRGGTFTLTNLGMFGIDAFTPVINLPECAILGVGRIKPQPAVVNDQVVVRQKMWLSLTFDHRLVDGGPAARFLQRVAQLIEKPHLLLS